MRRSVIFRPRNVVLGRPADRCEAVGGDRPKETASPGEKSAGLARRGVKQPDRGRADQMPSAGALIGIDRGQVIAIEIDPAGTAVLGSARRGSASTPADRPYRENREESRAYRRESGCRCAAPRPRPGRARSDGPLRRDRGRIRLIAGRHPPQRGAGAAGARRSSRPEIVASSFARRRHQRVVIDRQRPESRHRLDHSVECARTR